MTVIKMNGSVWGQAPLETLEQLYPLFEQYTLDPIYEWYGNFVNRTPVWQRAKEQQAYQGCTIISGQFLHYGHFFYIVTDDEKLIQRFECLVADNKRTQTYQNERMRCFPCRICNQWSATGCLCKLTGRFRNPDWECFARYLPQERRPEKYGENTQIKFLIPGEAGQEAVLIERGKWTVK